MAFVTVVRILTRNTPVETKGNHEKIRTAGVPARPVTALLTCSVFYHCPAPVADVCTGIVTLGPLVMQADTSRHGIELFIPTSLLFFLRRSHLLWVI
jgi:hypothetical protein